MRVMHRVIFYADEEARRVVDGLGLKVKANDGGGIVRPSFSFEIAESDQMWPDVLALISARPHSDWVSVSFSPAETAAAQWVELLPEWHHGYPQPEVGYLGQTYDTSAYCAECGIGAVQAAPFRMVREPRWGRRSILQLNWVFDEYFVTPDLWETVFEPHGIAYRPALLRSGATMQTVVQLVIDEEVGIRTNELDPEICPTCGRTKYASIRRIPLPELVEKPSGHAARTTESFGSGGSAYRAVVLSQTLGAALRTAKVRGAVLQPVAPLQAD